MNKRTICKYPLSLKGTVVISAQGNNPKLLHIGLQDSKFYAWIEVDNKSTEVTSFSIHVKGTGWVFNKSTTVEYFSTVIDEDLVWHFYVEKK